MTPPGRQLRMYGAPSTEPTLDWAWVHGQLVTAGTYWVIAATDRHPHARPVWGVWDDGRIHLSVGSPTLLTQLDDRRPATVHLDSSNDVVVVEGVVTATADDQRLVDLYDEKYDWAYSVEHYGPFRTFTATTVLAWRSAGWAGRDGFQQTGRWDIEPDGSSA